MAERAMAGMDRRGMLGLGAAALLAPLRARAEDTVTLPFGNGERPVLAYPGKRPLIRLTARPPQLETPFSVYGESLITPNDAFFVRYHLADIPTAIDPETYRVAVKGLVDRPLSLSLNEIKALGGTDLVAAHQCSGNGRGFFEPRVAGGQAANGLMGNAKWTGVPLRAVLDKAGVKAGAAHVSFQGLDRPVMDTTPAFMKALPIDLARSPDVLLAWAMNGQDLPFLNGYPLRLVVPGYFGTYWVKHLETITVLDAPLNNFWMTSAYRIPDNDCNCVTPGTAPAKTKPIGQFKVRSFITSVLPGGVVKSGTDTLAGFAFDGGSGIKTVEISSDGGAQWQAATLGADMGRYSFRGWTLPVSLSPGDHTLRVRATSNAGETQPTEQPWNPSGYLHNVIETTQVRAVA